MSKTEGELDKCVSLGRKNSNIRIVNCKKNGIEELKCFCTVYSEYTDVNKKNYFYSCEKLWDRAGGH